MKIYVNGRFLTQKITGVQRVAIEILKELDKSNSLDEELEITILVPRGCVFEINFRNIRIREVGFLKGHLWEQINLPFVTKNDLLINFCNTSPIFKKRQITFIHDAAVYSCEKAYSKVFILWYRLLYLCTSLFTKKVITVSSFSKQELIRYLPKLEEKTDVIYNGVDHFKQVELDESIFERKGIQKGNYILAVGSMHPNKNFKIIIDALENLNKDITLVIAGGLNERVFSNLENLNDENVIKVGYVSDEELKALYSYAKLFVFPSVYEGFGIPPLEAMSVGCPVIASNKASIPEICEDRVLYFDPYNKEELLQQINKVWKDDSLAKQLSEAGCSLVDKYSWNKASRDLIKIIKNIYR